MTFLINTREKEFWCCIGAVHVRRKSISRPLNLTIFTQKQKNNFDSQLRFSNWFVLGNQFHCSELIHFKVQVVHRKSCALRTWKKVSIAILTYTKGKILFLNWDVKICHTHTKAYRYLNTLFTHSQYIC